MININFKTDNDFLAKLVLSMNKVPVDLANYLWVKYQDSYSYIHRHFGSKEFDDNKVDDNLLTELKEHEFFKQISEEGEQNLQRIKILWEEKKDEINSFLKNILKKEFNLTTNAIIVAPRLCIGCNTGNNNFIWGHIDGIENGNYDLVYLIHESLHSYFPNNEITHAIIENIADFELSYYLNKNKIISKGHKSLINLHKKIFPYWCLYLNKGIDYIKKYLEDDSTYDFEKLEKYQSKIVKMNIDDFVMFLESLELDKDLIYSINTKE